MRHVGSAALDALEDLLARVRRFDALKERTRGSFYCRSGGFLHFHEDPAGLFADLKTGDDYERFPVNTPAECRQLVDRIAAQIAGDHPRSPQRANGKERQPCAQGDGHAHRC